MSIFWLVKWSLNEWIGLREKLQESPIFNGNIYGFQLRFSRENQAIEYGDRIDK